MSPSRRTVRLARRRRRRAALAGALTAVLVAGAVFAVNVAGSTAAASDREAVERAALREAIARVDDTLTTATFATDSARATLSAARDAAASIDDADAAPAAVAAIDDALRAFADSSADTAWAALGEWSDAERSVEDDLAQRIDALRDADADGVAPAAGAVAAAIDAVVADASAYRDELIAHAAALNTQPTGGDVTGQLEYLSTYVYDYNSDEWGDYNDYGGDCTNFASQGLVARGWKIDDSWYSRGAMWTASKPWIATAAMGAYFDSLGLDYSTEEDLDRVRVGDVGLFDWGENGTGLDHTMTVSKVEYSPDGPVVYFIGHNEDSEARELRHALYTEHSDSSVRIYHIP